MSVVVSFVSRPCLVLSDDYKADLWSAGAVLYELVAAKHPFGGANQVSKGRVTFGRVEKDLCVSKRE